MATTEKRRFIRADGPDKVTGSGRYTADLNLTGMLYAKFKFAGVSHGRITRLDTSKAEALPGVFAVAAHADVPDVLYGDFVQDRHLFCKEYVRYEGDTVAAVAALTPEIAQQAVDLIEVEYEKLPVVNDIEAALAPDAPLVHVDWASYGDTDGMVRDRNDASHSTIVKGDIEQGMRDADLVIKSRFVADGSHPVPIEPRAIVAQWSGDHVTIWTSTQVPFAARSGVMDTLELPASKVRIIVPILGGGFGGKCGFHYEAHIAVLARKAARPVKLVFTRREEFLAPDKRREGMVIEIESGIKKDGTITARRGYLVIDNGAYTADSAFFSELAAMHIHGPYKTQTAFIDAHCVYTNHQPSGSVRAPTAPQACWALEQHTDELAAAIGMDPVEFRRKNCIDTGDEGPTRQVYLPIGLHECIANAAEMSGYGQELPEDEAIGLAVGWWPTFGVPSGAYVKLNADGSGVIVTGAQECGTGSVMTLPMLAADELGMQPEDFTLVYQDTDAGPWDMGATGSQTLVNNGRAVVAAAKQVAEQLRQLAGDQMEASPEDIELVDGFAQVKGSPDSRVALAELAATAHGGELLLGTGSGPVPDGPRDRQHELRRQARHGRLDGPAGQLPRGAGEARPRHGRRACARGLVLARLGHDHQPGRRRGPGRGRRHDGHGPGALGGHEVRRRRQAAQRRPARVQAPDDARRPADHGQVGADQRARRRSARIEGRRRGAQRRDRGRDRERALQAHRRPASQAPDDARAHLGAHAGGGLVSYTAAHTLDEAVAAMAAGARPVAGGSDLVVGARQGKFTLPGSLVGIHGVSGLGSISVEGGALVLGALVNHAEIEESAEVAAGWTGLADGSALVGSPATRYVGTIGGNVMNSSPAMDTGAALLVLGAEVELRSQSGSRTVACPTSGRAQARPPPTTASCSWQVRVPALPARSGSAYLRLEYRRAMEIAVVGAAAAVTLNGDGDVEACRVALTAVAPTIVRSASAEAAIVGKPVNEETLAAVAAGASADAAPISDVRAGEAYRRHTVGVMARRAVETAIARARGEHVPVPANRASGVGAPLGG